MEPILRQAMQARLAQRHRPCNQTRVTQFRVWDRGCGVCGLLRVQVFRAILGLGCGRCRNMLEPLPAFFWSLPGALRRRPLRRRQLLPSRRKHSDLRELHGFWSFGCIREPFGQRRAGEFKASFRATGSSGQSFQFGGDVGQVRYRKTMRLRVEGSSLRFQGVATKCFGAFFAESPVNSTPRV